MNKTGFLYDDRYRLHDTGAYHPECPARLPAIYSGIENAGLLDKLTLIKARPVDMKWVETVHDPAYIKRFQDACQAGDTTFIYPDNQMCAITFDIAKLAVGGLLEAVRMVMAGEIDNAFCAVRPPGHHAETNKAMGFCYFNNIAIAARYLQQEWGIKKIGILDFDVHHGNGTQHIFENDPGVFYYSVHEHPSFAFPGTGRVFEAGEGDGQGFTQNFPMLPGQGDSDYKAMLGTDLLPAFEKFAPQVLLISTGFDAHVDDDMSGINLSTAAYASLMINFVGIAKRHCSGRVISVLEGGYCLKKLPELARDHVLALLES